MLKVSVNMLTWNCVNTVKDTLSVLKDDLKDVSHDIIVVDNGSTDGSEKYATISNRRNLGVSIGKNQAIDISTGEYIFMLDGDIVPVPNSINCLIDWLDNHPKEYAIGFYPNKFTDQKNKNLQRHHEIYCYELFEPTIHSQAIAFYGLFRRSMFDTPKIRFPVEGPFSGEGYGWEDSDLYMQMREKGIEQWVAGINTATGRYYHEINSSIRHMGTDKYRKTSIERGAWFKEKWGQDKIDEYYPGGKRA